MSKQREPLKHILSLLARLGFSAALLTYLFKKIDIHHIVAALRQADLSVLGSAAAVFFIIHMIILIRWMIFMKALDLQLPLKEIISYFFIGLFFNLFLPSSTGGDLMKGIGLCQYTPAKAKVVASIVLDRLSGFAGIVLVALAAYLCGFQLIRDWPLLWAILFLGGVVLGILFVLLNEKVYSFGCRAFSRLPKVQQALMSLHYDLALLKNKRSAFYQGVAVSCLSQTLLALTFYLVARALHQNIAFVHFLIFVPIICVVASLPSIGGLGVRDAGAVYLLGKVGVAAATAVSISLINFFFMVAMGLLGGLVCVTHVSPGRVQYHRPHSSVGAKVT